MERKKLLPIVLVAISCSITQSFAQSKWTHPGSWDSLVLGTDNPVVKDTISVQDFEDLTYQTGYTVEGKHDYFYPKEEGIEKASDGKAIRLYPGSQLKLGTFFFESYSGVLLNVPYAIQHANKGENIVFSCHRQNPGENIVDDIPWKIPENDYSCGFAASQTIDGENCYSYWSVSGDPLNLTIQITESSTPSDGGYYCIDRIYISGRNRENSLFHSPGNWHQAELWSHHYPTHNRNALIRGEVTVDAPAVCKEMVICNANIQLLEGGSLQTEKITTLLPFPEKGKWYFVSFPFDVYPEHIDSRFDLGDETTQTLEKTNNVFYVQVYDGIRRSEQNVASGNWQVIPEDAMQDDAPLFRKGQGYLVALDKTAGTDTLCFTSASNEKLTFTPTMEIAIEADQSQQGDSEHNGWFLCGNPFPSSISIQDIQSNPDLDGYIYCYESGEYKAYPIGDSEHVLAPFAAFFVKAKRNTQLRISKSSINKASSFRSALQLYSGEHSDPTITANESPVPTINYKLQGENIFLYNLPGTGRLTIFDIQGKQLHSAKLPAGNSQYSLPNADGIYLIRLNVGEWLETIKYRE